MTTYWQGIGFGLAYIAPIGLQNLFMIKTALAQARPRALIVAGFVTFFDISLALASFFGIGQLLVTFHWLKLLILLVGSLIILYMGYGLLREKPDTTLEPSSDFRYGAAFVTAFSVAWLNPQAILDGTMLLGAFRVSLQGAAADWFVTGVCTASIIWFFGIALVLTWLRERFKPVFLVWLNRICGVVILVYGVRLMVDFIQAVA